MLARLVYSTCMEKAEEQPTLTGSAILLPVYAPLKAVKMSNFVGLFQFVF